MTLHSILSAKSETLSVSSSTLWVTVPASVSAGGAGLPVITETPVVPTGVEVDTVPCGSQIVYPTSYVHDFRWKKSIQYRFRERQTV